MTALNQSQAAANIVSFYQSYLPTLLAKLPNAYQSSVDLFHALMDAGYSLKSSYDQVIAQAVISAGSFENAYPSNPVPTPTQSLNPIAFVNTIPANEVITYLYPNVSAADKASLTASIQNGSLSVSDLASAISLLKPTTANPTADQIQHAGEALGSGANLPDAGLSFPGLSDQQLGFLTSMYIGAFGRTPEYEGLKYWASELAGELNHGVGQMAAFVATGNNIYKAGSQNGEAGTTLNTADYLTFAYNNALGRTADTAGYNYWMHDLTSGAISRGDFLATFLTAGLNQARDESFLAGRIAVGEFAAQQHVSGKGASGIDTKGILSGVTDVASAQSVINSIIQKYGTASSPKAEQVDVFHGITSQEFSSLIELTGVQAHDVHVLG